jgi:hypothetical protein
MFACWPAFKITIGFCTNSIPQLNAHTLSLKGGSSVIESDVSVSCEQDCEAVRFDNSGIPLEH